MKERLNTDIQAYTCVEGVSRTFRRRLTAAQGLALADSFLGAAGDLHGRLGRVGACGLLRHRAEMIAEVQALRRDHNLSPDNPIASVADALRHRILPRDRTKAINARPAGSAEFRDLPGPDPDALRPTIL